jgi:mannan endo-1,4-beta-mannosidase
MVRLLRRLATEPGFALGQQDTSAYGVGWSGDADRSDVKSLCGSHVAVYGWDLFGIEKDSAQNGDGVDFGHMRRLIADAYRRGGLNTISWHMDNPKSGGNAWDITPAVHDILPGGPLHQRFVGFLDRAADFLQTLRGDSGELIPVLFRPFHEHTGSWFWWGGTHTTDQDFISLWHFTLDYLRKERGLDLLVAFSPAAGELKRDADYFYRYPGDEVVDVFGVDQYTGNDPSELVRKVELVVRVAEAHGKIPALTEFGARGGLNGGEIDPDWVVQDALGPLLASPVATRIAYALAWRNARVDHCFLPYPGHPGAAAFQTLCAGAGVALERDLHRLESSQASKIGSKLD